jgi:hypothetical protein
MYKEDGSSGGIKKSLQPNKESIQNNIWSIALEGWQDVLEKSRSWKWRHFHQLYETTAAE